jgi:hypothetical protein
MRSARWIVLGAALAAAACADDGPSPPPAPSDHDGDGFAGVYDCNESDPAVHTVVTAYPDEDGDGIGSGTEDWYCTDGGAPPGRSLDPTDCAPSDPTAWRVVELVDRDADGFTASETPPLCVDAALPDFARTEPEGNDCDDADPALFRWMVLYPDLDGDGVGTRPRSILCVGEAVPAGWSRLGYDVDDTDPSVASAPGADDLAQILD